jgi:hypothetical protein
MPTDCVFGLTSKTSETAVGKIVRVRALIKLKYFAVQLVLKYDVSITSRTYDYIINYTAPYTTISLNFFLFKILAIRVETYYKSTSCRMGCLPS